MVVFLEDKQLRLIDLFIGILYTPYYFLKQRIQFFMNLLSFFSSPYSTP